MGIDHAVPGNVCFHLYRRSGIVWNNDLGTSYLYGYHLYDGIANFLSTDLHSKISAFLAVFRKIIVLIPLIYILPMILEDDVFAVFLAEPIADVIAVATTVTLFYKEFKKLQQQMEA